LFLYLLRAGASSATLRRVRNIQPYWTSHHARGPVDLSSSQLWMRRIGTQVRWLPSRRPSLDQSVQQNLHRFLRYVTKNLPMALTRHRHRRMRRVLMNAQTTPESGRSVVPDLQVHRRLPTPVLPGRRLLWGHRLRRVMAVDGLGASRQRNPPPKIPARARQVPAPAQVARNPPLIARRGQNLKSLASEKANIPGGEATKLPH